MIHNKFIVACFMIIIFSCSINKRDKQVKNYTIGNLRLTVPASMIFKERKGIDSYVAFLINTDKKNDTFNIEYGDKNTVYSIDATSPHVLPLNEKEELIKLSGKVPSIDEVIFSPYYKEDEAQKIFEKNYYMYDTVYGLVVKIIQPKKIGDGITGMYIPALKDGNSFSIYARNLDSSSHQEAIKMFKTITYR